ncbi:MAG: allantoicase [Cyanobacteria bacterium RYN_339]|nr:allantoicase [Cyanobacteria bacterium RYN_339]
MTAPDFTDMIDLASVRVGGKALYATDDFFAEKENLLNPGRGIFITDKYTENGKWMDGWESRRKRVPGHDFCVVQLGLPGRIHGFDVDTNHFTGNYPEHCRIEATELAPGASWENASWTELVGMTELQGGSQHFLPVSNPNRFTHVRLHIYPDGGVARLRVYGEVHAILEPGELVDLAAVENGGTSALANDMYFSHRNNLVMPGRAANMGDGWETKRKRAPGNDWVIVKLGTPGSLEKVEIDTNHFKGNFPESAALEGVYIPHEVPATFLTSRSLDWQPILPRTKLEAHMQHYFDVSGGPYTHVRLSIFPDGGISRLRLHGRPEARQ